MQILFISQKAFLRYQFGKSENEGVEQKPPRKPFFKSGIACANVPRVFQFSLNVINEIFVSVFAL